MPVFGRDECMKGKSSQGVFEREIGRRKLERLVTNLDT